MKIAKELSKILAVCVLLEAAWASDTQPDNTGTDSSDTSRRTSTESQQNSSNAAPVEEDEFDFDLMLRLRAESEKRKKEWAEFVAANPINPRWYW